MYNLSHLLLRRHTNLPVGGHHKSTFILHKSLLRGTSHSFFPEFTESFKGQAASLKGGGGGKGGRGYSPIHVVDVSLFGGVCGSTKRFCTVLTKIVACSVCTETY